MDGLYHVSWALDAALPQKIANQRADLLTAANLGLNLMAVSHLGDLKATGRLLDLAASRGMMLIIEDLSPTEAKSLSVKPAFLAHAVMDDANRKTVEQVQAACTASTVMPRYASIGPGFADDCARYYGLPDGMGVQSYTYPDESLATSLSIWQTARRNADAAGVRLIANTQLHDAYGGAPSAEWIRAQTWVAAAAGCDDILGYTMLDQGGALSKPLLTAFAAACAEVRSLTSGRATCTVTNDQLTATWPAGVSVVIDLSKGRVLSLKRRKEKS
ncbi:hypothetical protein [Deinococcus alpinitundrae]|uniref:hypothetical protein n=1 Tax=Deinococcus alpinitundrae TaxID=468913 RepID=UPI00137A6AAF|nr:hypothetical protein [Deinococcus alpinitundrae]